MSDKRQPPLGHWVRRRFIWWRDLPPLGSGAAEGPPVLPAVPAVRDGALMQYSDDGESVEWINMCWRKVGGRGPGCFRSNDGIS